jgi:hypothetical protein
MGQGHSGGVVPVPGDAAPPPPVPASCDSADVTAPCYSGHSYDADDYQDEYALRK